MAVVVLHAGGHLNHQDHGWKVMVMVMMMMMMTMMTMMMMMMMR